MSLQRRARDSSPSDPPPSPAGCSASAGEQEATAEERTDVDATVLSPEHAAADRLPSHLDGRDSSIESQPSTSSVPSSPAPTPTTRRCATASTRRAAGEPPATERSDTVRTAAAREHERGMLPVVSPEHYDIDRVFARGGIGEISKAWDRRLDRVVAIKELRRSTRYARMRFAREVAITARLQHPSIIPVYEAGRWPDGGPFLAMKLVDGGSLDEAIAARPEIEERMRLVRNVADVADALAYAHSQSIVHRDLKPSNVLLGPFGETVVIDWGLAKILDDDDLDALPTPDESTTAGRYRTTDGVVMGTPHYMPPEQAAGPAVDARADVYALGAILYQVLSGRPPYFEAEAKHVLTRLAAGPPTSIDDVAAAAPRDLRAIVRKAMSRRAGDRYPTASEMARELERFLTGGLVSAHQYSAAELLWRFAKRYRTAVLTALAAVVAIVLVA
ncbi:MAG: serine/threonine protein kinase, partial [Deltaproteobacteria bacterium]|nr:serine/threonine protein kinase [Deltaproteobacteria bacterium]